MKLLPPFARRCGQLCALALALASFTLPTQAVAGFLQPMTAGDLAISEFRLRGPNGPNDEYIEIYNSTPNAITVQAYDFTAGLAVRASNGTTVFVIPNGTVIPAHGHYLGVNSVGYSLGSYPAGSGTTATGDITWTTDVPDNSGLALFQSSTTFDLTTRLDAAGFTTSPALYREGAGIPTINGAFNIDCALYRFHLQAPATAAINDPAVALTDGEPRDTDDNIKDFAWVDTNGTSAGAGQRLGAPAPKNLSSPIAAHTAPDNFSRALLDPSAALSAMPNRVFDPTPVPGPTSTSGTLEFRRTFTNNTGAPLTRLRLRVVKLTTFPAPFGTADLRPITSATGLVGTRTVVGTTLEQNPSQPNGGGWNSTFSVNSVTPVTPLAAGATIDLRVLFGLEQLGVYRFALLVEAQPAAAHLWIVTGDTANAATESEDGVSAPVISSTLAANGTYGTAIATYTIAASGNPTSYSASGLPSGLTVDTNNGQITGTPATTGTFNVTIGASNSSGSDSRTLVLTIAQAPLAVSGVTANDRTYDATNAASLDATGASLNGVVSGDNVVLNTGSAIGTFNDAAAGPNKTVFVSGLTITGTAAGNYALTQPTTMASVNPAPVIVTANSGQSKIVGASDPVFTYTMTGGVLFGSDSFSGALGRASGETAGSYAITPDSLTAGKNYAITFNSAAFNINEPNVAPVANAQSASTNEDVAKTLVLTGTDGDSNPLSYIIVSSPQYGTLSGAAPNVTYTPNGNFFGTDSFTFKVNDGTVDSAPATVDLTIASVNDAPFFNPGGDQAVAQDAGPQTVIGWADKANPGTLNEASQTLNFIVSVDNAALFTTPPAIASNGTLTYAPAPNGSGTATVTVTLQDNGGTSNGGVNASAPVTFKIAITTFDEEPGIYNGLAQAAPQTTPDNARAGLVRVRVSKKGTFTGSLKLAGATFRLRGNVDKAGVAHFGTTQATTFALPRAGQSALALSLQLDVTGSTDKLAGTITDAGAPFAVIDADRSLYTAAKVLKAPFLRIPAHLPGRYTVAFDTQDSTRLPSEYPQGDGIGILTVRKSGLTRFRGTLADGTPVSSVNAMSRNTTWPLYVAFAAGKGSISGMVTFRDVPVTSDLDSSALDWFKPAQASAQRYPAGWPTGLRPTLVGCKFVQPALGTSVLPGLTAVTAAGNAQVVIVDGNLPQTINRMVNVNGENLVKVPTPGAENLVFRLRFLNIEPTSPLYMDLASAVGRTEGSFIHPVTRTRAAVYGVILQKQGFGTGFFLGATESGSITITPTP